MYINLLKYSIKNILRNKFLSISSILVLTLLMFFINTLLVLHNLSFKLIDSINSKISISLYLQDDYDKTTNDVVDLINNIKSISPKIKVVYKDKTQVLEDIRKKDSELVKILEKNNPLPNTILISNIPLNVYNKLNNIIENKIYLFTDTKNTSNSNIDKIADYKSQFKRINKTIQVLKTLQVWLYIIIVVFLLSIAIIIYSIIWNFIYYYKDEIYITKLVWWSNMFIYWPFSLQWMIYSFISFFISLAIFLLALKNVVLLFWDEYKMWFLLNNAWLVFPIELWVFMLIWAISWYFSTKKYLK